MLGGDEYGFGTVAMIATGCIMARGEENVGMQWAWHADTSAAQKKSCSVAVGLFSRHYPHSFQQQLA